MPSNFEDWTTVIASLLGGGFAGAAVVTLLSKLLIKNQLEKSLKKFQHDLDTQKELLQTELAIYAERTKLRVTNHQQKSSAALEAVYSAFVKTSLPRQKFRKIVARPTELDLPEDKANSAYFQLFSANFQAFSRAFDSISQAFSCLEEQAIYLDSETETQIATTLAAINSCYQKWLADLHREHDSAQAMSRQNTLNRTTRTMDFNRFHTDLSVDWKKIAGPVTKALKTKARELLSPNV